VISRTSVISRDYRNFRLAKARMSWILQAHLQAFLALDELRVLVALFREINNVHPVALIVQSGSGRDVLCLRRAQGDSIRIRLPLHAVALQFRVSQQWIHSICSWCDLVASRVPV